MFKQATLTKYPRPLSNHGGRGAAALPLSAASAAAALGAVTLQSQTVLHLREGVLGNEAQTQTAAGNHKSLRPLPPLGGYDPPGIMECNWE